MPKAKHLGNRWGALLVTTSLFSLLAAMPAAWAQETEKLLRTLTVTGLGVETVATALTEVQLGVTAQGASAEAVRSTLAERMNAVVNFLNGQNVDQLETTAINLRPTYRRDPQTRERTIVGYTGTTTVSFRTPNDRASRVLDGAIQAGANQVNRVRFVASEAALKAAQKEALREATQDAQAQADVVLRSLDLEAQEIATIRVNRAALPAPRTLRTRLADEAAAAAPIPVVAGEQTVRAAVTLQIRY